MSKTVEDYKNEIERDRKALEEKAFDIFCKRELKRQLEFVKENKETLDSSVERLESLTIQALRKAFKGYNRNMMDTEEEIIIKEILR